MSIEVIFQCVELSAKVLELTEIIESKLDVNLNKLMNSELDAGIRALQQAVTSEKEQVYLLREARSNFNKAISLEKNERLVSAYLGLATCHYDLGDRINCIKALRSIYNIEFNLSLDKTELLVEVGKDNLFEHGEYNLLSTIGFASVGYKLYKGKTVAQKNVKDKKTNLLELKSDIRRLLGD